MQEIQIMVILLYLSIAMNLLVFLRYVLPKVIDWYKQKKILRETQRKQEIHDIVYKYLNSIAKNKDSD